MQCPEQRTGYLPSGISRRIKVEERNERMERQGVAGGGGTEDKANQTVNNCGTVKRKGVSGTAKGGEGARRGWWVRRLASCKTRRVL